jgi:hypothetical protein
LIEHLFSRGVAGDVRRPREELPARPYGAPHATEHENGPGTVCRGHSLELSGKECVPGLTILLAALTLAALPALLAALTGLICLVLLSALMTAALLATLLTALVLLVRAFVRHAVPLSGVVQQHINRSNMASVPESRCGNIVHHARIQLFLT